MRPGDEKRMHKGFYHEPDWEQVKEYATWPLERRAAWLFAGLKARKLLPKEVRELQDQFRRGER
jgi:hypothetical protein